jgi:hypothetical protein
MAVFHRVVQTIATGILKAFHISQKLNPNNVLTKQWGLQVPSVSVTSYSQTSNCMTKDTVE